jgi:ribosome-binding factor A
MPEQKEKRILEMLEKNVYFLQQKINERLRMRPIPKISFRGEEKTKEAGRIEKILERLKKEKN